MEPTTLTETDSILDSVKLANGYDPEDDSFDVEILMYINTAFSLIHSRSDHSPSVFVVKDRNDIWTRYPLASAIELIKTYVSLYVRLYFSPPESGYGTKNISDNLEHLLFQISVLE